MSKYLARLNAIIQEKHLPNQVPKVPEAPSVTFGTGGGKRVCRNDAAKANPFGTFGTPHGRRVFGIDGAPQPDEAEIEERKGMAMASVPEPYLDTWARLQCQRPFGASDQEWWQVIDDAGRFLDQWGSRAVEFGWTAGDLFDVPRDGKSGLVWYLAGETVRSIGPDGAFTTSGRVFDRLTRDEWIKPYSKEGGA